MTGASCANMAFKIAEALGCDPIILVGQDLAFGEEGSTHTGAVPWGSFQSGLAQDRTGRFKVKGNVQEWVETNDNWNMFRLSYVKDVAEFEGTVINATPVKGCSPGGAYIEGTVLMAFREALEKYIDTTAPFNISEIIAEKLKPHTAAEIANYNRWLRDKQFPETIKAIEKALDEIIKIINRVELCGR